MGGGNDEVYLYMNSEHHTIKGVTTILDFSIEDKVVFENNHSLYTKSKTNNDNDLEIKSFEFKLILKDFYKKYGAHKIVYDNNKVYLIVDNNGKTLVGDEFENTLRANSDENFYIFGRNGGDYLYGLGVEDHLYGEEGIDFLDGGYGKDTLNGGIGNDTLGNSLQTSNEYKGDDSSTPSSTVNNGNIYEGGKDNDTMYGTRYGDVYKFNFGDGIDTIEDYSTNPHTQTNKDIIQFLGDIKYTDISISRINYDIILKNKTNSDSITIIGGLNYDNGNNYSKIEEVHFPSGVVWDFDYIKGQALILEGTENRDELRGLNEYKNILLGNDEDDNLYGGLLGDRLTGGLGNDFLKGKNKDDTYHYLFKSDNDTIEDEGGTDTIYIFTLKNKNEIKVSMSYNDVKFIIDDENSITISKAARDVRYQIENFIFSDGVATWDEMIRLPRDCWFDSINPFSTSSLNVNSTETSTCETEEQTPPEKVTLEGICGSTMDYSNHVVSLLNLQISSNNKCKIIAHTINVITIDQNYLHGNLDVNGELAFLEEVDLRLDALIHNDGDLIVNGKLNITTLTTNKIGNQYVYGELNVTKTMLKGTVVNSVKGSIVADRPAELTNAVISVDEMILLNADVVFNDSMIMGSFSGTGILSINDSLCPLSLTYEGGDIIYENIKMNPTSTSYNRSCSIKAENVYLNSMNPTYPKGILTVEGNVHMADGFADALYYFSLIIKNGDLINYGMNKINSLSLTNGTLINLSGGNLEIRIVNLLDENAYISNNGTDIVKIHNLSVNSPNYLLGSGEIDVLGKTTLTENSLTVDEATTLENLYVTSNQEITLNADLTLNNLYSTSVIRIKEGSTGKLIIKDSYCPTSVIYIGGEIDLDNIMFYSTNSSYTRNCSLEAETVNFNSMDQLSQRGHLTVYGNLNIADLVSDSLYYLTLTVDNGNITNNGINKFKQLNLSEGNLINTSESKIDFTTMYLRVDAYVDTAENGVTVSNLYTDRGKTKIGEGDIVVNSKTSLIGNVIFNETATFDKLYLTSSQNITLNADVILTNIYSSTYIKVTEESTGLLTLKDGYCATTLLYPSGNVNLENIKFNYTSSRYSRSCNITALNTELISQYELYSKGNLTINGNLYLADSFSQLTYYLFLTINNGQLTNNGMNSVNRITLNNSTLINSLAGGLKLNDLYLTNNSKVDTVESGVETYRLHIDNGLVNIGSGNVSVTSETKVIGSEITISQPTQLEKLYLTYSQKLNLLDNISLSNMSNNSYVNIKEGSTGTVTIQDGYCPKSLIYVDGTVHLNNIKFGTTSQPLCNITAKDVYFNSVNQEYRNGIVTINGNTHLADGFMDYLHLFQLKIMNGNVYNNGLNTFYRLEIENGTISGEELLTTASCRFKLNGLYYKSPNNMELCP